jgi:hypothetical protein
MTKSEVDLTCLACGEIVDPDDPLMPVPVGTLSGPRFTHRECALREVMGGIGHQIAHEYWCLQRHDPDAGLSYRHSAQLVWKLTQLVGADEVARRASDVPGVSEEEPEPPTWVSGWQAVSQALWEGEREQEDAEPDDDWAVAIVRWAENEEPPEELPPPRPDQ